MQIVHRNGSIHLNWFIESEPGIETGKTTRCQYSVELPTAEADQLLTNGQLRAALEESRLWNFKQQELKKAELKHEYQKLTNRSILR